MGLKFQKHNRNCKNNSSILNSGYLPSLSISSGGNYTGSDTEIAFPGQFDDQGNPLPNRVFEDQEAQRFNAGLNLNYTLFDGLGRRYTYKRLKEEYALSELQLRETIEFTTLQLFEVYFNIAQLTESQEISQETLDISKDRLRELRLLLFMDRGINSRFLMLKSTLQMIVLI